MAPTLLHSWAGGASAASAPDAGAGWGKDDEARLAWEAANALDGLDEEEFSFTPQIKNVKGITSTMGDFMRGWSEKRELHILETRSELQELEKEELPFQPELPAKATNETLLQGSGYAGPIQAWRQHADRYKQAREREAALPEAMKAEGKKPSRQRSWGAVVQRLYPYPAKASDSLIQDLSTTGPATTTLMPAAPDQAAEPDNSHKASGDVSAGVAVADRSAGPVDTNPSVEADSVLNRSANTPSRRYGRPPKATWQYLHETGTRKLRGKSMPPQAENYTTPRPLQRSEQMAKNEGFARRPLCPPAPRLRSSTPTRMGATGMASSASAPLARDDSRPRSAGGTSSSGCQRLFELSERQKLRHEQRMLLASEVKVAEEMKECTFRPQTNCARRAVAHDDPASASSSVGESSLSLYERGLRWRQRRQQRLEEGAQERAEAELSHCTFRPDTRRGKKNAEAETPSRPAASVMSASGFAESVSGEASFRDAGLTASFTQDLTATVLTMLDDWRSPAPSFSPPSRVPDQYRQQGHEVLQQHSSPYSPKQEPDGAAFAGVEGNMDMHVQRHEPATSDIQALLQDWRGGWGGSARPPPAAQVGSPVSKGPSPPQSSPQPHIASSSLSPPTNAPAMPRPVAGNEANVLAILENWRSQQRVGMP